MKLDREFNTIWCKELGPYDYVDVLFETSNGHYLGAGRHYLVLLDLNGNVEWERNYGANNGTMPRFSRDIVEVGNDQFIVAGDAPPTHFVRGDCEGNSCFDSYDSSDLFNIKIDIQGNLIWENYIEYEWAEYANAIAPTPDGGFIIAGTMENPVGDGELYYVKADSVGNEVWSKALGGWDDWDHYYYSANAIIPTNDGCYVMSGKLNDNTFILKINEFGDILWQREVEMDGRQWMKSMAKTMDGNFVLVGTMERGAVLETTRDL